MVAFLRQLCPFPGLGLGQGWLGWGSLARSGPQRALLPPAGPQLGPPPAAARLPPPQGVTCPDEIMYVNNRTPTTITVIIIFLILLGIPVHSPPPPLPDPLGRTAGDTAGPGRPPPCVGGGSRRRSLARTRTPPLSVTAFPVLPGLGDLSPEGNPRGPSESPELRKPWSSGLSAAPAPARRPPRPGPRSQAAEEGSDRQFPAIVSLGLLSYPAPARPLSPRRLCSLASPKPGL